MVFLLLYDEMLDFIDQNSDFEAVFARFGDMVYEYELEGKIEILGKNVAKMSTKELFNIVSYVPQAKNYGLSLSVIEMVLLGLNLCVAHTPKREHIERAQRILDELEIAHLRDKICSRLSGGELQMVIFARSLVKDPRIVVLDEPESNLDYIPAFSSIHFRYSMISLISWSLMC